MYHLSLEISPPLFYHGTQFSITYLGHAVKGKSDYIHSVAWSPDGALIASGLGCSERADRHDGEQTRCEGDCVVA